MDFALKILKVFYTYFGAESPRMFVGFLVIFGGVLGLGVGLMLVSEYNKRQQPETPTINASNQSGQIFHNPNITGNNNQIVTGGMTQNNINSAGNLMIGVAHNVTINNNPQRTLQTTNALSDLQRYRNIQAFFHWHDDIESITFKNSLFEHLQSALWNPVQSASHAGDDSVSNVIIEINHDRLPVDKSMSAATALATILRSNSISVSIVTDAQNVLPQDAMYIRIGPVR